MREVLDRLLDGVDLTQAGAQQLMIDLTSGRLDQTMAAALLAALRAKGETADEVRGFADGMRGLALKPELDASGACDVVGTGGDNSGSLNLSTGAALLAASAGVPIVKHGNRSMSSSSGSADVLSALGLQLPLDEVQAGQLYSATGFTFLFAPYYHPAMGAVVPVRKALGVRTVFNLLGPLTNPGRPPFAVIGAWSLDAARLIAEALVGTDVRRAFVCHGSNGWDEPTPIGPFHLFDVNGGRVAESVIDPLDFGLERCRPEELLGGEPTRNAASMTAVFNGAPGPHRDALVLGAGLALEVSGSVDDLETGLAMASSAIDDGRAAATVEAVSGRS